jgi:hypothetical protein
MVEPLCLFFGQDTSSLEDPDELSLELNRQERVMLAIQLLTDLPED